jgi:hypothetical protein
MYVIYICIHISHTNTSLEFTTFEPFRDPAPAVLPNPPPPPVPPPPVPFFDGGAVPEADGFACIIARAAAGPRSPRVLRVLRGERLLVAPADAVGDGAAVGDGDGCSICAALRFEARLKTSEFLSLLSLAVTGLGLTLTRSERCCGVAATSPVSVSVDRGSEVVAALARGGGPGGGSFLSSCPCLSFCLMLAPCGREAVDAEEAG